MVKSKGTGQARREASLVRVPTETEDNFACMWERQSLKGETGLCKEEAFRDSVVYVIKFWLHTG